MNTPQGNFYSGEPGMPSQEERDAIHDFTSKPKDQQTKAELKRLRAEYNKVTPIYHNVNLSDTASDVISLTDRADGVKGHFCIMWKDEIGTARFWNQKQQKWLSAGTVFIATDCETTGAPMGKQATTWDEVVEALQRGYVPKGMEEHIMQASENPLPVTPIIKDAALFKLMSRFQYHPNRHHQTAEKHQQIREQCYKLAVLMSTIVPEGHEYDTALAKLEETMMWANAGIARNQPNPVEPTEVSVDQIDCGPLQRKLDETIVAAFKHDGPYEPIVVRYLGNGRYQLIDGFHRLEAQKRMGKETVKARVIKTEQL